MTTEAIFDKYANAIDDALGSPTVIPLGAALLALRLAIADAHAAGAEIVDDLVGIIASQAQSTPEQRQQESLHAQISLLNEWLAAHAPAHYWSPTNTAEAVLAVLESQRQQLTGLQQQLVQPDVGKLRVDVDPTPADQSMAAARDAIATAQGMTEANRSIEVRGL